MGFWDKLKSAAEWTGSKIQSGLEWAGNKIKEGIGAIKSSIQNMRKPKQAEEIIDPPQYEHETAEFINGKMHAFLEANLPEVDILESEVLDVCQSVFAEHVAALSNYIDQYRLDIDMHEFDRASLTLEKEFKGRLKAHIRSKFSLSDAACLVAFSSDDPYDRLVYWNNLIDSGLNQVNASVMQYFEKQNDLIQNTIQTRLNEQSALVLLEQTQLTQLLQVKNSDQTVQEQAKMRVEFAVDCCEVGQGYIAAA